MNGCGHPQASPSPQPAAPQRDPDPESTMIQLLAQTRGQGPRCVPSGGRASGSQRGDAGPGSGFSSGSSQCPKKPRQLPGRRRRWRNLAGLGSPVPPWVSPPHPVLTSARSPSVGPGSGRAAAQGDGKWQEKWGERKSSRSPWKPGEAPCRCEERGWGRSPGSPCHPPAGVFVGTQPPSCSGVAVPWRLAVPMPGAPITSLTLDGDPAHPKPAGRAG